MVTGLCDQKQKNIMSMNSGGNHNSLGLKLVLFVQPSSASVEHAWPLNAVCEVQVGTVVVENRSCSFM